ncbi:MAG: Na+/H+ antiporter subunit E [Burkholderiaceae bacterium]|nr:Na+/H+ antiporter subunit E [Burkholderiaceae bacterium]MCU0927810.1 Na+/H+ antiporter subunit E [Burkholderiaceae bacterium]
MTPRPRDDGGWFAHPALSVLLAVVWLLLRQSVAPADLIAAVVLGLVVPKVTHRFLGPATRPRAFATALRFTLVVLWDIVVSNITVARIVLSPASNPRPAWVPVPLDTRHPTAISLLATIITMTPGTVSCIVDDEAGRILVHALDCDDPPAMAAQIKDRYERPLMEIFR